MKLLRLYFLIGKDMTSRLKLQEQTSVFSEMDGRIFKPVPNDVDKYASDYHYNSYSDFQASCNAKAKSVERHLHALMCSA